MPIRRKQETTSFFNCQRHGNLRSHLTMHLCPNGWKLEVPLCLTEHYPVKM
jgi:hypothetical protein